MRKVFTSLAPLKKIRPSKKTSLFIGYLLVVALLIVLVVWGGPAGNPLEITRYIPGEVGVGREEQAAVISERPFDPREDGLAQGLLPNEDAHIMQAMPQEGMRWPLEGPVVFAHQQVYRIGNQLRINVGINIQAAAGATVQAAWPGVVELVTKDPLLGWLLQISHGGGYLTQYANLQEEPYVSVGDEVKSGDLLGVVGESARLAASTGTFLHFAVYNDGQALDPLQFLSPR
ncbi:MAG: M23 family metallopeptidase [Dethiobacter sp.]|jgi:murein DD-endopeptidase MepM/ murein hydrolase activator NlpD|nr:M23 family metallopeptidase [Dethiobacter sp.]MBS3902548.1 M23 family metallopeptidase [Dethiobacter sp.]MBS3989290.1 M23 family metallopeptidase [Dethiobacter sp.]